MDQISHPSLPSTRYTMLETHLSKAVTLPLSSGDLLIADGFSQRVLTGTCTKYQTLLHISLVGQASALLLQPVPFSIQIKFIFRQNY